MLVVTIVVTKEIFDIVLLGRKITYPQEFPYRRSSFDSTFVATGCSKLKALLEGTAVSGGPTYRSNNRVTLFNF